MRLTLRRPSYSFDPKRDGVSQSVLNAFLDCRELCRMSTVLGYAEPGASWPLVFGSISHTVLELYYARLCHGQAPDMPADVDAAVARYRASDENATRQHDEMAEEAQAILHVMMPEYQRRWRERDVRVTWVASEPEFRVPFDDYDMVGKMDGLFQENEEHWILETKNKSRFNQTYDLWLAIDLQLQYYLEAVRYVYRIVPAGAVYNLIRRPERPTKKSESAAEFFAKLREDVRKRSDHYFVRFKARFSKAELDANHRSVHAKIKTFVEWFRSQDHSGRDPNYNPGACNRFTKDCFCLESCANDDRSTLPRKKRPHPELGV